MLPFGMTIPAIVPQKSEIPEGLMNYPVFSLPKYGIANPCHFVRRGGFYKWRVKYEGIPVHVMKLYGV